MNGKEVDRVDELMVEYNVLEPVRNDKQMILSELLFKKDSLESTLEATNDLTSNQTHMYAVLMGINTAVPGRSLKLTKIDYKGGNEILIDGMSSDDTSILEFIDNLAVIDVIEKAALKTMSVKKVSNQDVKSFIIKVVMVQQETIDSREEVSDGD